MAGLGALGSAPLGAEGFGIFTLRVRAFRMQAVFDKGEALAAVFDKAADVTVATDTEY